MASTFFRDPPAMQNMPRATTVADRYFTDLHSAVACRIRFAVSDHSCMLCIVHVAGSTNPA